MSAKFSDTTKEIIDIAQKLPKHIQEASLIMGLAMVKMHDVVGGDKENIEDLRNEVKMMVDELSVKKLLSMYHMLLTFKD